MLNTACTAIAKKAAKLQEHGGALLPTAVTWWPRLQALFDAIANGAPALGLPPYNGGLFHDEPGSLLRRLTLPDAVLAPLVDLMSREGPAFDQRWINYRDLSVQHLGSIYERLLERDVVPDGTGGVTLRPNPFARKTTGSYYTPEELVQLIVRRTVGPFSQNGVRDSQPRQGTRERQARQDGAARLLAPFDPAESFCNFASAIRRWVRGISSSPWSITSRREILDVWPTRRHASPGPNTARHWRRGLRGSALTSSHRRQNIAGKFARSNWTIATSSAA